MNFFQTLLKKHNLTKHDGRPFWSYTINEEDFENLKKTIEFSSKFYLDPRDAALYFSIWWKRNYNGGIPSKQEVFDSLGGNVRFNLDVNEFYKIAKKGANLLGVKWIKKQNTLYFKTLLLQGGLPLKHISENKSTYKAFLEAVLEEQPESIEDFIFKAHIIDLLPKSSQNDIVYENCFEIVRSILNDDKEYQELLESEESLKEISSSLKIKKASLNRKVRQSKPKNYWLLNLKNNVGKINLRLGLADKYSKDTLSNILGFEVVNNNYQFFLEDDLVCVFRKMLNGQFNTDWHNAAKKDWDISKGIPNTYVIIDDQKVEVKDFIPSIPNLEEPSLWSKFSDNEWRFIKGNTASNVEAALLFPNSWYADIFSSQINISSIDMSWLPFQGEIQLQAIENKRRTFLSGVNSFDWLIESKKPRWMLKSSLPVTQGIPSVHIFDEDGYHIKRNEFKVYTKKHNTIEPWTNLIDLTYIQPGCYDLKIEKEGVIAYDVYFNIAHFQVKFSEQSIHFANVAFRNLEHFQCQLYESTLIQIEKESDSYQLKVNTEYSKIPLAIKSSIGYAGKKKLIFEMASPFQGMAIIDNEGKLVQNDHPLSFSNLYGLRILSTPGNETFLKIKNTLKPDVTITKQIKESTQPLISFKDEILRLFYLADAMDFANRVSLELSENKEKQFYQIAGFSHTLDVSSQLSNQIKLNNSEDQLELFAVPLNCESGLIDVLPLVESESWYTIPKLEFSSKFIVISANKQNYKLMPRFVSTTEVSSEESQLERINKYHSELQETKFESEIWKQVIVYFFICFQYDIPYSTFDQLRAISRSSEVASRTFLFLGYYHIHDFTEFIQKAVPDLEKDLGFCFHWVSKTDWLNAINEINQPDSFKYLQKFSELISSYFEENNLRELFNYINGSKIQPQTILHADIRDIRAKLGERVLNELPYSSPKVCNNYNIQIKENKKVRLLLQAPIAVSESIFDLHEKHSFWGGDEKRQVIRRSIQYAQYLNPNFYKRIIFHTLNRI
ncbi:hypothetical protein [Polaribacter sp. R77954]|uniref:hypothetical protein n=1 Tax=Polaribacter sp. R77954 TaxID=3093870 RepID=UPI0037CCAAB2